MITVTVPASWIIIICSSNNSYNNNQVYLIIILLSLLFKILITRPTLNLSRFLIVRITQIYKRHSLTTIIIINRHHFSLIVKTIIRQFFNLRPRWTIQITIIHNIHILTRINTGRIIKISIMVRWWIWILTTVSHILRFHLFLTLCQITIL